MFEIPRDRIYTDVYINQLFLLTLFSLAAIHRRMIVKIIILDVVHRKKKKSKIIRTTSVEIARFITEAYTFICIHFSCDKSCDFALAQYVLI